MMESNRTSCKQNLHQSVLEASQGPDNLDKTMMGWMKEWEQGSASRLCKTAVDSLSLFEMSFFIFQTENTTKYFLPNSLENKVLRRRMRKPTFAVMLLCY